MIYGLLKTLFVGIPRAVFREWLCAILGHRLDPQAKPASRPLCSRCKRRVPSSLPQ